MNNNQKTLLLSIAVWIVVGLILVLLLLAILGCDAEFNAHLYITNNLGQNVHMVLTQDNELIYGEWIIPPDEKTVRKVAPGIYDMTAVTEDLQHVIHGENWRVRPFGIYMVEF